MTQKSLLGSCAWYLLRKRGGTRARKAERWVKSEGALKTYQEFSLEVHAYWVRGMDKGSGTVLSLKEHAQMYL